MPLPYARAGVGSQGYFLSGEHSRLWHADARPAPALRTQTAERTTDSRHPRNQRALHRSGSAPAMYGVLSHCSSNHGIRRMVLSRGRDLLDLRQNELDLPDAALAALPSDTAATLEHIAPESLAMTNAYVAVASRRPKSAAARFDTLWDEAWPWQRHQLFRLARQADERAVVRAGQASKGQSSRVAVRLHAPWSQQQQQQPTGEHGASMEAGAMHECRLAAYRHATAPPRRLPASASQLHARHGHDACSNAHGAARAGSSRRAVVRMGSSVHQQALRAGRSRPASAGTFLSRGTPAVPSSRHDHVLGSPGWWRALRGEPTSPKRPDASLE